MSGECRLKCVTFRTRRRNKGEICRDLTHNRVDVCFICLKPGEVVCKAGIGCGYICRRHRSRSLRIQVATVGQSRGAFARRFKARAFNCLGKSEKQFDFSHPNRVLQRAPGNHRCSGIHIGFSVPSEERVAALGSGGFHSFLRRIGAGMNHKERHHWKGEKKLAPR